MATMPLVRPTTDFVRGIIEQVRGDYHVQHAGLRFLLTKFPRNHSLDEVVIKVAAIDSFYKTNLGKIKMPRGDIIAPLAKRIVYLDIDSRLNRKDPPSELVNKIANVETDYGKTVHLYVFASKYCCWHKPDVYPRIDTHVRHCLLALQSQYGCEKGFPKFSEDEIDNQKDHFDYVQFKNIVEQLRHHFGLTQFNFDDLDQFFWQYDKEP